MKKESKDQIILRELISELYYYKGVESAILIPPPENQKQAVLDSIEIRVLALEQRITKQIKKMNNEPDQIYVYASKN